jgi:hypothetical protein
MSPLLPPLNVEAPGADPYWKARVPYLVWGFVILGTVIRLVGYLLRFPLWVDECMLAENFLDRDFPGLLAPLDHHQVAPIGFLWIELAAVKLFGYSEWSLRLFPLLCGIGSLFIFRRLASRLLGGVPLVLAVGCLAVAKAPVGLSANVKPYATDLLVAVSLLAIAVEWLRRPDQTRWLWSLAAAIPLALTLSFPAVLVGGAVSLGLFLPVCRGRNRRTWEAYIACNVLLCATFAGVLAMSTGPEFHQTRAFMADYWTAHCGFPPLLEPARLATWLLDVHLGDRIFCVPYGTENGGGAPALICCVVAAVVMSRRGQRPVLTMFLATFALTFVASAVQRYPYGGHNRLMQFLVPAICLAAGLGAATLLARLTHPGLRCRMTTGLILALAVFGIGVCGRDLWHPWHFAPDEHHREFARQFWKENPAMFTLCSRTDLGHDFCPGGWYAYYRCNQQIYSPPHHAGRRLPASAIDLIARPIRLVVYDPPGQELDLWAVADCLKHFESGFEFAGHEEHQLPATRDGADLYGRYRVFRFVPRPELAQSRLPAPVGSVPWVRFRE